MFQLKFDDKFNNITRDIPHWETEADIPDNIKKFITDTSDKRVIYEESTKKFYCGKCVRELDSNNYCKKCDIQHKKYTSEDIFDYIDVQEIHSMAPRKDWYEDFYLPDEDYNYFVFDIIGENVILYNIVEEVTYYNPFFKTPYKSSTLYIDTSNSYYIEKNGVTNLEDNVFISFKNINEYVENFKNGSCPENKTKIQSIIEKIEYKIHEAYIYVDNLILLKDTIYRYSKIWELDNFLKEQNYFRISQFIYYPLYYPQFEYLMKHKLYDLVLNAYRWFQSGKNFKEVFGIDKKYLPVMVENNITYNEFRILQIYPTTDIEIIRFFSSYCYLIEMLSQKIKVDLIKLKDYLLENGLSHHYICDYVDYIDMAKKLQLDLNDKKVLYPKNFIETHDELFTRVEVMKDPLINEKIKSLSCVLAFNRYEDDDYVIYPASSIEELIDESSQQHNCVRGYCERVADNDSQIYFMRKKTDLNKSLVTIEVHDREIVQARVKYNELPSEELNYILHKWEKNLIPITNE